MKAFRYNNKLGIKWNHTSLAPTYTKKKRQYLDKWMFVLMIFLSVCVSTFVSYKMWIEWMMIMIKSKRNELILSFKENRSFRKVNDLLLGRSVLIKAHVNFNETWKNLIWIMFQPINTARVNICVKFVPLHISFFITLVVYTCLLLLWL